MIGGVVLHQQPLFHPRSLTANGLTEQFTYDADGERLSRTHGGLTTYYIGDWLEYDVQGGAVVAYRFLFRCNGQVVATNTPTQWVFLLADHLGSTSVVADASNNVLNTQDFDPWGAIRSGSAPQTSVNYTGQRRDATGLLYYHSRYYNPATAHFLSPDTLVPGMSGAAIGPDQNASLRALTVDFHESGFTAGLNQENAFTQSKGFWFQLSNDARGQAKQPWGPANPQALNRYSYVLDNPLRYTDPTGHYNYTFDWFIAPSNLASPETVMKELQNNPQKYFPFRLTPKPGGPTTMVEGAVFTLDPGVPGSLPYDVKVVNVTPTSFSFVVITSGGFAPVGSTITFSTYEKNGSVYLQQHGVTAPCGLNPIECLRQIAEVAGAGLTWGEMSKRLWKHYNEGFGPPKRCEYGCVIPP